MMFPRSAGGIASAAFLLLCACGPAPTPPTTAGVEAPTTELTPAEACKRGRAEACTQVAAQFEAGRDVPKDERRAVELYEQACRRGDKVGCVHLGAMLEEGRGVAVNIDRAVDLYIDACQHGVRLGCIRFGVLKAGVLKASDEAAARKKEIVALYQAGCDVYIAHACASLAFALDMDDLASPERVIELYKRACDGRSPLGCGMLGARYSSGLGVPKDQKRAQELYTIGCEGGHFASCLNLAYGLERDQFGAKDEARAARLSQDA